MKIIRLRKIIAIVEGQIWSEWLAVLTLASEDTGLPMVVGLTTRDTDHKGPRVNVSRDHGQKLNLDRLASVSISDDPRLVGGAGLPSQDLRLVQSWILLNKDTLLRHWSGSLSTADMMAALRPLGPPRGRK